ncbi:MAG: ribulose-phosphate 3-epimerase [Ignavibacteriales bacterium CG12_big_fil_rev_8_21_14_0_65_30_8]|nr:MAG: ribulose-phosphate 3-epimerase [Ignavibacteriales bacterium CG12_big_fil_rev_8_21_14_0_65_30_8]
MALLAPSILSSDFSNLSQQIRLVEMSGADWIHCDVMDGHFVPNITFGPIVIKAAKKCTKLPLDVHLMIENPDKYLEDFYNAGSNTITVHQETCPHLHRTISKIKELGAKAGVSVNPSTPLSTIEDIADEIDLLLIMSVNPGFGGQSFIKNSIKKIESAVKLRERIKADFLIEVDGGINKNTSKNILDAGCDVFVAGSSIFKTDNIAASVVELKKIINSN